MKIIAYLLMVIDHVGLFYYPDSEWMRLIGRFSLPCYVSMLVDGVKYTSNINRYFLRLLSWAVISQVVIWINVGYQGYLNILFSLSLGLVVLLSWDRMDRCSLWSRWGLVLIWAWLATFLKLDYGWYLVALTMCYRLQSFGGFWVLLHYFCPVSQGIAVLSPWVVRKLKLFDDRFLKIDWYAAYAFQWCFL